MTRARILVSTLICLLVVAPAAATNDDTGTPDPQAIALRVTNQTILPAYEALEGATATQVAYWQQAQANQCEDTAALGVAYQIVADKWAAAAHWNFGPITGLLRRDRFYHWPERRNAVAKSMQKAFAERDVSKLHKNEFTKSSVGLQGLPALERLLYDKIDIRGDAYGCALGLAIATNLDVIVAGTISDWRNDVLPAIAAGTEHPVYFDNAQDVVNRLFTDYLTAFTIIKDQKLIGPMGRNAAAANPKRAEAWRSGRPLYNLHINLTALADEGMIWGSYAGANEANHLAAMFARAENKLFLIEDFSSAITSDDGRTTLNAFIVDLTAIQAYLRETVAPKIGVNIGFNALDGD